MYLLAFFILQNFKKIFRANPDYKDVPFSGPKSPNYPEQIFFGTNHYYYFHLPISPFHSPNFKDILQQIQNYEDVPFSGPKLPNCPEQSFFGANHYYYFHLPISPFHSANFKEILQQIQNYEDVPLLGPKRSICPNFFFEKKIIKSFSSTCQSLSLQKLLKNYYSRSKVMRMHHFGPRMAHLPK